MYAVKAAEAPEISGRTRYNRQERWNADGLVPGYAGSPAGGTRCRAGSCMGENDEEEGNGIAGGTLYMNR